MGRGGHRWGAGRPGWHGKAEQSMTLDVRVLARRGLLSNCAFTWRWRITATDEEVGSIGVTAGHGVLYLRFRSNGSVVEQRIRLDETACHFGGTRPWFRCPQCDRRVALVYSRGSRFGCRACRQIVYSSQSEDVIARTWRKQQKLERQLNEDWSRPKGMHRATHKRLMAAVFNCDEVREYHLGLMLDRFLADGLI